MRWCGHRGLYPTTEWRVDIPSDLWTPSSSLEDSSAPRDGRQEEKVGRREEEKGEEERVRGFTIRRRPWGKWAAEIHDDLNFPHLEVRPQSSCPVRMDQAREIVVQLQALQQEETKQRREDELPVPRAVMSLDDYIGRLYDGPDSHCQSQSYTIFPPDRDFTITVELWSLDGAAPFS